MAEGFARHYGAGVIEVSSAGTRPSGYVHPRAIEAMKEKGIDIGGQSSKRLDLDFTRRADHVITMGCSAEDACPAYLLPKVVDWDLEDPVGQQIEKYRETRDKIEVLVRRLIKNARED